MWLRTRAPPAPPEFNVAPRVVAANALIDCTTRIRVFSDLNIEMGGRGGVALPTADPRNLEELPNAHPSRWCKDSGINRLGSSSFPTSRERASPFCDHHPAQLLNK